ncbi:MAG: RNA polymerase sigma-54 factor, partial [Muribaculaceae bacterium]|nr:RNA polymerase sigma-54 factor [Muribaculaceae bacterium]
IRHHAYARGLGEVYKRLPFGVYPLKKFFNEKISDTDDSMTAGQVMARIKAAIEAESPSKPLSDREITQLLNDEGFPVARRTVAKYRENLGFPVARLRKRI